MSKKVAVFTGEELARYNFGESHPFGPYRQAAFTEELHSRGLDKRVEPHRPVQGTDEQVLWFHTSAYLDKVRQLSNRGNGLLDEGDTPAFTGVYEASLTVVGTTLAAVDTVINSSVRRAFTPIAGLHHARRDTAAGFCVFNDCGVAIEALRREYNINNIAYVDIDAHHGDGVFYSFIDDPALCFVDIHEDGRSLYPGTGSIEETGTGAASGTKLNIPMPMGANDDLFYKVWEKAEQFIEKAEPEFILLQCGADSIAGDPITHMEYSAAAHAHAAERLCGVADRYSQGRIVAMGGGGYNLENIASGWCAVVEAFISS